MGTKGTSRGGKGAEASRGHLTIAIVAIVAVAIWLAVTADPWQSWSHDGFWEMDRPLADPAALYAELPELRRHAQAVLQGAEGRPGHIFNLGHGVMPDVKPENVKALVEMVHEMGTRR